MKFMILIGALLVSLGAKAENLTAAKIEKLEIELTEKAFVELKDKGYNDKQIDKLIAIEDHEKFMDALMKEVSPELRAKILDLREEKKRASAIESKKTGK